METTVGLFGPTGSGKTTVIKAFIYAIQRYKDELLPNHPLKIRITGSDISDGLEILTAPPEATQKASFQSFNFSRLPSDEKSKLQRISSFTHKITIYDNKGALFASGSQSEVGNIRIRTPEQFRDQYIEAFDAWDDIRSNAAGIVVLLDHQLVGNDATGETNLFADSSDNEPFLFGSVEQESGISDPNMVFDELRNKTTFTRGEYARLIRRLSDENWVPPRITTPHGEITRKVAICISKSDLLNLPKGVYQPVKIMERIFGEEMISQVTTLEQIYGKENVGLFVISALGLDPIDELPNYDPREQWLKNKNSWKPIDVEKPFLWILQRLEEDYLKQLQKETRFTALFGRSERHYIPYFDEL